MCPLLQACLPLCCIISDSVSPSLSDRLLLRLLWSAGSSARWLAFLETLRRTTPPPPPNPHPTPPGFGGGLFL